MAKRDYYSVLDLPRGASEKEIKQAYRRLARQYHPDVNPGNPAAERKFKEISEAYTVLSNPESRTNYDHFGHQDFASGGDASSFGRHSGFGGGQNAHMRDFFTGRVPFGEGFGAIFEEMLGGGRSRATQTPTPGQNLEQFAEIGFEEAISGTTLQVHVRRRDGHTERLQVKIPPGVETGAKVRVAGKGELGTYGATAGDLYLVLRIRPHAYFSRQGSDILCEVPVTLTEAMLGAKIDVPTIDGRTTMTLPSGTQNGRQFRLRGKGIASNGVRGDQYVTVHIVLPDSIDERSRMLLEEFAMRNPLQPRAEMRW